MVVGTCAVPFGEDDCVFGLKRDVGGHGVDDKGFGEVAVEVGEVLGGLVSALFRRVGWLGNIYLDVFAVDVACCLSEKRP